MEEKKKEETSKSSDSKKSEKGNMNDIILDKINSNKKPVNIKKILLTAASLVLLFLIVLVGMKLVNNQKADDEVTLIPPTEQKNTPAPTPQKSVEDADKKLFNGVPVEEEKDSNQQMKKGDEGESDFDEMVKTLREKEIENTNVVQKEQEQEQTVKPKEEKIVKEIQQEIKNEPMVEKKQIPAEKKEVKKEQKPPKPVQTAKTVKPKPKTAPKPQPKKVCKIKGYYIQVSASFKTLPSRSFLKKIETNKLKYILKKSVVHGKKATKVLIGPYFSKEAALKDMPKIKTNINPNAFLLRIN